MPKRGLLSYGGLHNVRVAPGCAIKAPRPSPGRFQDVSRLRPSIQCLDGSISGDAEPKAAKAGFSQLLIRTAVWEYKIVTAMMSKAASETFSNPSRYKQFEG